LQGEVKRFEFIEHTADIGFRAYGSTLAEAYANAGYALFTVITDPETVREVESRKVELQEDNPEALLFEWLNILIYLFDTETILFKRFEINHFEDGELSATCHGEKYDASRHELKTGVKSATYHMLEVDRERKLVQVILDI
jgi:SHS2 domain-containing protein